MYKRKCDEINTDEKGLHLKPEKLKAEQTAAQSVLKVNNMMEVQAGKKLIKFERQQQSEANKKLSEILA